MERKIDWLGRITIPKEVRAQMHWNDNDYLEMTINGDTISFKKVQKDPLDLRRTTITMINDEKRKRVAQLKEMYQPGDRIKCLHLESDSFVIPEGMEGTVKCVDDLGSIFVVWDNKKELALLDIPGDSYEKVKGVKRK